MEQGKMEWVCKREDEQRGEAGGEEESPHGGGWIGISYERLDGRIQMLYLLFDSRGRLHCKFDWYVSRETERRRDDVNASPGLDSSAISFEVVRR